MGIEMILRYVAVSFAFMWIVVAVLFTYTIEGKWAKLARYVLNGLACLLFGLMPMPASAHIVTCREAGAVMADYAADRDRGVSLQAAMRDLSYANKGGSVSQIQMRRLRYDLRGIYEDYALRHATPGEIQGLYRDQCPDEFAPMIDIIQRWAQIEGVTLSQGAAQRLATLVAMDNIRHTTYVPDPNKPLASEAKVQSLVRIEAARNGVWLTRNNVGALRDDNGRPVRYGLANESKQQNEGIKSGDLIGLAKRLIRPEDVGTIIGQFFSRECKPEGWTYTGTEREVAQLAWVNFINANGGDACFVTGPGSFTKS